MTDEDAGPFDPFVPFAQEIADVMTGEMGWTAEQCSNLEVMLHFDKHVSGDKLRVSLIFSLPDSAT